MADAKLTVGIEVDAKDLGADLKQAEKQFDNFSTAVPKKINETSKTIVEANKKSGASFIGLSRVVQDAAFGPGAIANNLAGLGDDFKQLSAQAKESGQSIGKTLVQSLVGAGGLNLALSGLTLGLSLAQFGMGAWTRILGENKNATKSSTDALKDLEKANEDYVNSQEAVNRAQLQGGQNAQKELTNLKVLFNAYQNANLPLEKRKEAYKEIQDKYPEYFKNLEFEEKASKKTKTAYDELTGSILATARARAAGDLIAKNAEQLLIIEQKQAKLAKEIIELRGKDAAANEKAFKATTGRSEAQAIVAIDKANAIREKRNGLEKEFQDLRISMGNLNQENLRLETEITSQVQKGAKFSDDNNKSLKSTVDHYTKIAEINDHLFGIGAQVQIGQKFYNAEVEKTKDHITELNQIVNRGGFKSGILPNISEEAKVLLEQAMRFSEQFRSILQSGFQSGFESLGSAIGEAIVNSDNLFQALGQSILGSIGDILVQFGKMTIAAGIASTALGAALTNPFNPASGLAAIAAGVALVAVGSAVKAFSSNLGKGGSGSSSGGSKFERIPEFATGVTNFGGGMALVGERGPELVTMGRGANVITNENVNRFMNRQGSGPIVLGATVGIEMGQLVVALEREQKTRSRRV